MKTSIIYFVYLQKQCLLFTQPTIFHTCNVIYEKTAEQKNPIQCKKKKKFEELNKKYLMLSLHRTIFIMLKADKQ